MNAVGFHELITQSCSGCLYCITFPYHPYLESLLTLYIVLEGCRGIIPCTESPDTTPPYSHYLFSIGHGHGMLCTDLCRKQIKVCLLPNTASVFGHCNRNFNNRQSTFPKTCTYIQLANTTSVIVHTCKS